MSSAELEDLKVNVLERPYDPNREELPEVWTPEHVGRRLVDAFKVMDRTPRVGGPKGPGGNWPSYTYDMTDKRGWGEQRADREAEQNETRLRPTAIELRRMDEALDWLRELRAFDAGLALQLAAWASRTARHRTIRQLCVERGWSFQNFYRRTAKGKMWIAERLNSASSPVF